MRDYLNSDPILWIPSDIWFGFLELRVKYLQQTQVALVRSRPANLGIITGVISFLLRSVDMTPRMVPGHVRESLGLLRFKEIKARFGMFFLHDLELKNRNPLPEVQEYDTVELLREMRIASGASAGVGRRPQEPEGPSVAYPLGPNPRWADLKKAVEKEPWHMMRRWVTEPRPSFAGFVSRVFMKFTSHMLLDLRSDWLWHQQPPIVNSLAEAMAAWSVDEIGNRIKDITWLAIGAGLGSHVPGRPQSSFKERVEIFFPRRRSQMPPRSQWAVFTEEPGYLNFLWHHLEDMSEEAQDLVLDELGEVLQNIQCLPTSVPYSDTSRGRVWHVQGGGVEIVTNPRYYKVIECGTTRRPRRKGPPATQQAQQFRTALYNFEGVNRHLIEQRMVAARKKKNQKRSSTRHKGRRVPPKKKTGKEQEQEQEEQEEDEVEPEIEEEEEDEDEDDDDSEERPHSPGEDKDSSDETLESSSVESDREEESEGEAEED